VKGSFQEMKSSPQYDWFLNTMWGKAGERVMANAVTAAAFLNIANVTGLLSMQKHYQNF
jgi:hypothetical protein